MESKRPIEPLGSPSTPRRPNNLRSAIAGIALWVCSGAMSLINNGCSTTSMPLRGLKEAEDLTRSMFGGKNDNGGQAVCFRTDVLSDPNTGREGIISCTYYPSQSGGKRRNVWFPSSQKPQEDVKKVSQENDGGSLQISYIDPTSGKLVKLSMNGLPVGALDDEKFREMVINAVLGKLEHGVIQALLDQKGSITIRGIGGTVKYNF